MLDLDRAVDPATGETKRKQKWISVKGTKRCATLLFQTNVPAKNSGAAGHKRIKITLDTYAHVLRSMQLDAARRLSGMLSWR